MVPAMAPRWMPSAVVPPRTRASSLCRTANEQVPGRFPVPPGRHPGLDDPAERRSMGRPPAVVLEVAVDQLLVVDVAEPLQQLGQLFRRQEVEQHDDVRLLGHLVAIRAVPFGLQDAIQPVDFSVGGCGNGPNPARRDARSLQTG